MPTAASDGPGAPDRARAPQRPIPGALLRALRAVHGAELTTAGPARRVAWRTTRDLLGGVIAAGYSIREVADCLGVTVDSVRTRATRAGWLPTDALIDLLEVDRATVRQWRSDGLLPLERQAADGSISYPATDVIRAIAATGGPVGLSS